MSIPYSLLFFFCVWGKTLWRGGCHGIFYGFFVVWTLVLGVCTLGMVWVPGGVFKISRWWAAGILASARILLGIRVSIIGREHLPQEGAYLMACKHQSPWDTLIFSTFLTNPAFFLKQSLLSVPLIGWYFRSLGMIPVSRGTQKGRIKAYYQQWRAIQDAISQKRPLIIFPEGRRTEPGISGVYRSGVFKVYQKFHISVFPVSLNSGYFWRKHRFLKRPGIITLRIHPALKFDLDRESFMTELSETIEKSAQDLLKQAHLI